MHSFSSSLPLRKHAGFVGCKSIPPVVAVSYDAWLEEGFGSVRGLLR